MPSPSSNEIIENALLHDIMSHRRIEADEVTSASMTDPKRIQGGSTNVKNDG